MKKGFWSRIVLPILAVVLFAGCITEPMMDSDYDATDGVMSEQIGDEEGWVRTVVFMYKETSPGQDIFIKGGHDSGLVPSVYPTMSEDIIYNNTENDTTYTIKMNDSSLDWGTESALDWTCNDWPSGWGTERTYAVDGYGEDPENTFGLHWWKFDVMMAGETGDWYEFKAFMRESGNEWWENNISQTGTPYSTINHWGKKGYITKVSYGESWATFIPLNEPPVANATVSPSTGTVSTTFSFDASASTDAEDSTASLQVRWDWESDGTYDTGWTTTKTETHVFSVVGTKTVTVQVKDTEGSTSTDTVTVNVNPENGGDHPGYFSGDIGANVYDNGVEFSIYWRNSVASSVTVDIDGKGSYSMTYISSGDNANIWWVFLTNAEVGDEYKYTANGATTVADPYSKYNRYSNGDSVVVDQDAYTWHDDEWSRPGWDYYAIYELHVKDFTSDDDTVSAANRGKYLGVAEKLTYLTNLGVTAIELMPPSEFPDAGYSWGYNTSLFMSVESGYATQPFVGQLGVDEFKEMVDLCHQYGIAVVVDLVFNHTANNDNWLWQIDNVLYFDYNNNGNPADDQTPWGNKLATWKDEVKRLGKDTVEYFMTDLHVDGFRFDATHSWFMDHGFIRDLKYHASQLDPNVYFVYENLPNESDLKTWGGQWNDNYHDTGIEVYRGAGNATWMKWHIEAVPDWASSGVEKLNYVESHDEDTLGFHAFNPSYGCGYDYGTAMARSRLFSVILATSIGTPMMWMGQEFLRDREGQDIDEMPLDWDVYTANQSLTEYYGGIFRLRRDNYALRSGNISTMYDPNGGNNNIYAYARTGNVGDAKFVIVLNFDRWSAHTVTIGMPENGTWTKVMNEYQADRTETVSVNNYAMSVTVGANSAVVFMKQ